MVDRLDQVLIEPCFLTAGGHSRPHPSGRWIRVVADSNRCCSGCATS